MYTHVYIIYTVQYVVHVCMYYMCTYNIYMYMCATHVHYIIHVE